MKPEFDFLDDIMLQHTDKLKHWHDLLKEIMPDYFFKTFSKKQLGEILPLLFNIENETGIQRIEREDSIILIYLKSDDNNLLATSRMMRSHNISSAVTHESKQKIVVGNKPRTLVIEYFALADKEAEGGTPRYPFKDISAAYKQQFKKNPPELKEVYERINWHSVGDFSAEQLASRLNWILEVQDKDYVKVCIEKVGRQELRLTFVRTCDAQKGGFYYKIIEAVNLAGFNIERAYFRDMTISRNIDDFKHLPVTVNTLYLTSEKNISLNSEKIISMLRELKVLNWTSALDLFHRELVAKQGFTISETNLLRAAVEFVHTQLSFIDKNAYNSKDIYRLAAIYPNILADLIEYFKAKFSPDLSHSEKKITRVSHRIEKAIGSINTGMYEKDKMIKTIFQAALNFFENILKSNFYCDNKAALAFRMNPDFMSHYSAMSDNYTDAFPKDSPYGIFYFYRENAIGFHVRFSEIARGGWRTVIPKSSPNELERHDAYEFAKDEIFREVFVLAHTQHMKNKDIYEGGAKMISLLNLASNQKFKPVLFESQRAICAAFVSLINYNAKHKLRDKNIVDYLGDKEIIEIGPDENMFDPMIRWMGDYAQSVGYTLKSGIISGKPDSGINHKEYGVTSFGVHQYLLRTLTELQIDPGKDEFSIKISGGPFGDVAGNEMRLLLTKKNGHYMYPNLKIVAITDGPAVVYDPDGIDRDKLSKIVLKDNLDSFDPAALRGNGAYMIFSQPVTVQNAERYRMLVRSGNKLQEKMLGRDEFMKFFQSNIYHYADVFVPCGGRPSTINGSNWQDYLPGGKISSKAIIEGANSFITPDARVKLQETGIIDVKDASANKCGVITSSYEILCGLMLEPQEFIAVKKELVPEIMEKLRHHAEREAEWLFTQFKHAGALMTDLTETLSRRINAKNEAISAHLDEHPELITDQLILDHLPRIFSKKYQTRLERLPTEYKKAIVAVELATRIVYNQSDNLKQEIQVAVTG